VLEPSGGVPAVIIQLWRWGSSYSCLPRDRAWHAGRVYANTYYI